MHIKALLTIFGLAAFTLTTATPNTTRARSLTARDEELPPCGVAVFIGGWVAAHARASQFWDDRQRRITVSTKPDGSGASDAGDICYHDCGDKFWQDGDMVFKDNPVVGTFAVGQYDPRCNANELGQNCYPVLR